MILLLISAFGFIVPNVVLSLLGGLGFSLPLYYWLNQRSPK